MIEKGVITSRSNPTVVKLAKLQSKKYRDSEGLFIIEGEKLFAEAIYSGLDIEYVVISESFSKEAKEKIYELLRAERYKETEVLTLSDGVLEKISTEKSPQGIITVAKTIDFSKKYNKIYNNEKFLREESSDTRSLVMLCDVRDPGNLGAVLRCAAAFETDAVYVCKGCADIFSPKTVRGAMGALFKQPIIQAVDAAVQIRAMRECGVKVFAAALDRNAVELDRLFENIGSDASCCFVIGNEGSGLPEDIIGCCDGTVFIPMAQNTESLNASSAAAVLMWELFKKKRKRQ